MTHYQIHFLIAAWLVVFFVLLFFRAIGEPSRVKRITCGCLSALCLLAQVIIQQAGM